MRIGVFDSGVGGLSVGWTIQQAFPDDKVEVVEDVENLPYGTKTPQQLFELTLPILTDMAKRCQVIVIACNSLTTNCIADLRTAIPVPLVGLEPMVKPAAEQTKSGVIAVCATPATLASQRYHDLKHRYAQNVQVIEPDCSRWASLIQSNQLDRFSIHAQVEEACAAGVDVIVLGCTHYHWIEEMVREAAAGRAQVLQPEQAVIKRLWKVLRDLQPPR